MELHRKPETGEVGWREPEHGDGGAQSAGCQCRLHCSPGNELVQFVLSDVPLGLSKLAANYALYASHSRDVVSSGVQLALDRAYFGSSADAIPQQ